MRTGDKASRVVVGIDGSPSSQVALRWAVRHAGLIGATVEAVAAYELPGAPGFSAPTVDSDFDAEEARRGLVEEVREVLGDTGATQGTWCAATRSRSSWTLLRAPNCWWWVPGAAEVSPACCSAP